VHKCVITGTRGAFPPLLIMAEDEEEDEEGREEEANGSFPSAR
jgi:hypothetical protein